MVPLSNPLCERSLRTNFLGHPEQDALAIIDGDAIMQGVEDYSGRIPVPGESSQHMPRIVTGPHSHRLSHCPSVCVDHRLTTFTAGVNRVYRRPSIFLLGNVQLLKERLAAVAATVVNKDKQTLVK